VYRTTQNKNKNKKRIKNEKPLSSEVRSSIVREGSPLLGLRGLEWKRNQHNTTCTMHITSRNCSGNIDC